MLDSRGRVRLADFGIAAVRHRTDELAGTPAYMAPELFRGGTASAASDVFALGLVLWEIFTGRRPASSDLQDLAAGAEEGAAPAGPAGDLDAQTRRILALCLSADPPARPPAAWIAAALGGDDALRASMAAGHTPSPQAIALAGRSGAFDLRLAGACLAATVILMALAYHVSARISLAASVPLTNSPAALQFQAREHLRLLGVPDPGGHWASGFHLNGRVVNIVAALPPAEQATILATPGTRPSCSGIAPGPRRSCRIASTVPTLGDPPPSAGDVSISLGWNGALVALSHELPIGVGPAAGAASPPDRRAVFALARLDLDAFEAAPPRVSTQRSAGDTRLAWLERDGGPLGARRVEASLFRNELVAFSTVHDRAVPADTGPGADNAPRTRDVAQRLVSIVFDALLVVGVLIAWRQVRDGRADLRGATRLGFALLLCLVAARLLFRERLFATLGSDPIFRGMPFALASTAQVVIFYLAVEPFIRRRAPHQFISWSRLLAGRVTDPLVGRDLLTGILAGVVVQLIAHAAFWLELSASGPASTPLLGPLHIAEARQGVAYLLVVIHESVALTLVFTLLYAASVTVTRRTWAAVAVKFALGLAFVLASYNHWSGILVGALTLPIFLFVLLRIGTLGATALASTFFLINLDLVSDPGHWRFAATLAPGLVLLAVAGYAFAASTGLLRGRRGYGSLADS